MNRLSAAAAFNKTICGSEPAAETPPTPQLRFVPQPTGGAVPPEPPRPKAPRPPNLRLEALRSFQFSDTDPANYAEVKRITAMPIRVGITPEEYEAFCRRHTLASAYEEGWRYFPIQAEILFAYEQGKPGDGVFGPIGVGWGKTLVTLKIASFAYQLRRIRRMVLLIPGGAFYQLTQRDVAWARTKTTLGYPIYKIHGKVSAARRASMAKSKKPGLYVIPYSVLSRQHELISQIKPGLIICDEAHHLRDRHKAARTKRVMNYVNNTPGVEGVCLSGTMTQKRIRDYWHLLKWNTGELSPLPLAGGLAEAWGRTIDTDAAPTDSQTGPILPLVRWAKEHFKDPTDQKRLTATVAGFRHAYRLRLSSSPLVVATDDAQVGVALKLCNRPVEGFERADGWPELERLIEQVEQLWLSPSEDEIEHAMHKWKWNFELSAGFYNELVWPEPEVLAQRRRISTGYAAELLDGAEHAHELRQEYARLLRAWLHDHSLPGLDTPMLIASSMSREEGKRVGPELYAAWRAWHEAHDDKFPERDKQPVRVCDYKIRHAAKWALGELEGQTVRPVDEGGILWCWNRELAIWTVELFREWGLDPLDCPAGANELILDHDNGNRICVASLPSHGEGKNLQHFQHAAYLQWPRPARWAEQSLGRLHRNGQKADELNLFTFNTTLFDVQNFAACLTDALYISQTGQGRQKIVFAGYDPLPQVFPIEVLIERGFTVSRVDSSDLSERFRMVMT